MLKVGITGGIGSGKSTICRVFETLGIPVFYADDAAKYLMQHDEALVSSIKQLLGNEVYVAGKPDSKLISSIIFSQPEKLQQLNALVHPTTVQYGKTWMASQTTPYAIKEAAIFFESGTYTEMDIMIGVSAPPELRLRRTTQRTGLSEAQVLARMANQMNEDKKMKRCDYVIVNDDVQAVLPQVEALHRELMSKIPK